MELLRHLNGLTCPTPQDPHAENISRNLDLTNRFRSAENENPGALAGATGAWDEKAYDGNLDSDNALDSTVSSSVFYFDCASNSVQPLRELRAVLA